VLVQVLTCQASDYGGEGNLSNAEAEREDVDEKHYGGIVLVVSVDWCGWMSCRLSGG